MMHSYFRSLITLALIALPGHVFAATLTFESPSTTVSVGDTVVVRAYLDSGTDTLNALDGDVLFRTSTAHVALKEVSVSGSAFTVWPTNPAIAPDGKEATFTGGTPDGIPHEHALVASFVLTVASPGTLSISLKAAQGYKDDGAGTPVVVTAKPLTLSVAQALPGSTPRDQWAEVVGVDATPPAPFTVTVGEDPSVFDGKRFISFQTTDTQSGIDHYEVQEGTLQPVVSTGTYVLVNQHTTERVSVFAYDKAGNKTLASIDIGGVQTSLSWSIAAVFLLLFVSFYMILRRRNTHG